MTQRLSLARGLLGSPTFLLLDEPTRGLDPGSAEKLRYFVSEELVAKRGMTVLWATHDLQEMQSLCSTLVLLNQGRLAAYGDFDAIHDAMRDVFR